MPLTKEDLSYLQHETTDASPDDVKAARQLALEAGGTGDKVTIRVEDESSGEVELIDVKRVGNYTVGQIIDDSNSRTDNWQYNEGH